MGPRLTVLGLLCLLGACSGGTRAPEALSTQRPMDELAIVHVDVVDVANGELLPDRTVLIEEGRIMAVAPSSRLSVPPGAVVVDGTAKFLMPGLADMHVHFGRGGGLPNSPQSVERVLRQYLFYGVTTVLNLGAYHGRADQILELRRRREAGDILTPQIYATGGLLTVPGGHPLDHWPLPEGADPESHDWSERGVWVVRTEAEVRDVVGRTATAGMDGVKVVVESEHGDREIPQMPPEMVLAAVQEAGRYGLPVFAHAIGTAELQVAIEAGVHAVVHLVQRPEPPGPDVLEAMRRKAMYYVPTLSVFVPTGVWGDPADNLSDPFLRRGAEPLLIETLLESPQIPASAPTEEDWSYRRGVLRALKAAYDAGLDLVGGSDTPGAFHGYNMHHELALMVEAGLTPAEALTAATRNAAEMIGASDDFGTVEPGRRADLLLLSANPFADIENTRAIEDVILDGRVLDRQSLLH